MVESGQDVRDGERTEPVTAAAKSTVFKDSYLNVLVFPRLVWHTEVAGLHVSPHLGSMSDAHHDQSTQLVCTGACWIYTPATYLCGLSELGTWVAPHFWLH